MSPSGHPAVLFCLVSTFICASGSRGPLLEGPVLPMDVDGKIDSVDWVRSDGGAVHKVVRVKRQSETYFVCYDLDHHRVRCHKNFRNVTSTVAPGGTGTVPGVGSQARTTYPPGPYKPSSPISLTKPPSHSGFFTTYITPSRNSPPRRTGTRGPIWTTSPWEWTPIGSRNPVSQPSTTRQWTYAPRYPTSPLPQFTQRSTTKPWWLWGSTTLGPSTTAEPESFMRPILFYLIPSGFGLLIICLVASVLCCIYFKRQKKSRSEQDTSTKPRPVSSRRAAASSIKKPMQNGDTYKAPRGGSTRKPPLDGDTVKASRGDSTRKVPFHDAIWASEEKDMPWSVQGKEEIKLAIMPPGYPKNEDTLEKGSLEEGTSAVYDKSLPMVTSLTIQNECDTEYYDQPPDYHTAVNPSTNITRSNPHKSEKRGQSKRQSERQSKQPQKNKGEETSRKSRSASTNRDGNKRHSKSTSRRESGKGKS